MQVITDDISKYDNEWWEKFYKTYGHHNCAMELNHFQVAANIVGEKTVLDVGCGEGEASQFFLDYKGIDWSKTVVDRANSIFGDKFECKDIKEVKDHYDYAMLSQVFEHLEDPKHYLAQIKKVADKVIVILPNGDKGKEMVEGDKQHIPEMEDLDYHYATYTRKDIEDMFPQAQFIEVDPDNIFFIV